MGLFGDDKEKKIKEAAKKAEDARKEQIQNIVKSSEARLPTIRKHSTDIPVAKDYSQFLKEIAK